MDRDKNLLFGVLAVQLRKVTPGQIADIAAAWAADPVRDLPNRLVEAKLLSPADQDLLQSLVEEVVRDNGGNTGAALDQFRGVEAFAALHDSITPPTVKAAFSDDLQSEEDYLRALREAREQSGRYWLKSEHARGGQGRLLLVHDETLGRDIILKELLPNPDPDQERPSPVRRSASMVARFLQEAKITSQLEHPSIVPVYEVGLRPDSTPYYTMKLLKGKTFAEAIRGCKTLSERLRLVRNFSDICHGMAYAHSRGVIHRDLKPSNIMVGQFGETVVLDWGLAKVKGRPDVQLEAFEKTVIAIKAATGEGKTAPGALLGTPAYMSPEQARGEVKRVDERSDVYGLGMILYELIAGRLPFEKAPVSSIVMQVAREAPTPVQTFEPDAPPELVAICSRCLERDPKNRYQNAAEVAADVDRFLSGALVAAYSYNFWEIASRYYKRHRALVHAVAVFLVVLAGLGAYSYVSISQARDRAVAAHALAEDEKYVAEIRLARSYREAGDYASANEILRAIDPARRNWEWGHLFNRCNQALLTLQGCVAAAYSPDGSQLAAISKRKSIEIWDANTGEKLRQITEQANGAYTVRYSRDGSRLLATNLDNTAKVWENASGKLLCSFPKRAGEAGADLDPSSQRVVVVSDAGIVRVHDIVSGDVISTFNDPSGLLICATFSPDSQWVLSAPAPFANETPGAAPRPEIKVWNARTGELQLSVTGVAAEFNPAATQLAVINNGNLTIFDLASGTSSVSRGDLGSALSIVHYSRDGNRIVVASGDGELWALKADRLETLLHVKDEPGLTRAIPSPDGSLVLTATREADKIRLWDVATRTVRNTLEGHLKTSLFTAEFNPSGDRIVTGSMDETIRVWGAYESPGRRTLVAYQSTAKPETANRPPVLNRMRVSRDTTLAAFLLDNRTMEIRRTDDGSLVAAMASYGYQGCSDAAFSPDNKRIVAALDEFTPMVWDIASGQVVSKFTGHNGAIYALDFSATGKYVVSASWDNTAKVWDASTGVEVLTLTGHTDAVCCVAFAPDGTRIATGSEDGTAILWDAQSGHPVHVLRGHNGPVVCTRFSEDGKLLVTGGDDKSAILWNVASGEQLHVLRGHKAQVRDASFSPDTSRLATGSTDGSIRIWDVSTGKELTSSTECGPQIASLEFARATKSLLVANTGGGVFELLPAPWKISESPGVAFAATTTLKNGSANGESRPRRNLYQIGTGPVTVATTMEAQVNAMKRLTEALPTATRDRDALIADGSVYDALARLCMLRGDEVLTVNGVSVSSQDFPALVAKLASAPASGNDPIEIGIRRGPNEFLFRYRQIELETATTTKNVDIALAREFFTIDHELQRNYLTDSIKGNQERALDIGDPVSGEGNLNGLWIDDNNQIDVKKHYMAFGLATGDRIVAIDGKHVDDFAIFQKLGSDTLAGNGNQFTRQVTFEVARGQFQFIRLLVSTR